MGGLGEGDRRCGARIDILSNSDSVNTLIGVDTKFSHDLNTVDTSSLW